MAPHDQYEAGPGNPRFPDQDASLGQYLVPLIRKWWIVVIVLGLTLLLAVAITRLSDSTATYEARTRLLIVVPVSERLIGESGGGTSPITRLSIDTLSTLVAANDLLETVIKKLGLHDSGGEPWDPTRLANMMESEIETADAGTNVPLLTTTVRGGDPKLAAQIAQTWAEAFIQKNSELFASEAAGSYEFVAGQYQSVQEDLSATQAERLAYEQASRAERLAYEVARQAERLALEKAHREDKLIFERDNPLASLKSELDVLTEEYRDVLRQLSVKRSAAVAAQARLVSVAESLAAEDPFLTYERRISTDAIWSIAAGNPDGLAKDALSDLVLDDQERNDLYLTLREKTASLKSDIASLTAEIDHMESRAEETEQEIANLTTHIGRIELDLVVFDLDTADVLGRFDRETAAELAKLDGDANLVLFQLDQKTSVLTSNSDRLVQSLREAEIAKAEQAGSIRIVEPAVAPRSSVAAARGQFGIGLGPIAAIGLFLGVVAAAAVYYVQNLLRSAPATGSAPKGEPES